MATPPGISQLDPGDFPALPDRDKLVRALNPFMGATAAALRAGLTFRENFAGAVKALEVTCPDDWTLLSLQSPFSNFGGAYATAAVRKTNEGMLKLRGLLKASVAPPAGTLIAALPKGYETKAPELFGQRTDTGQGEIRIEPDNTIRWRTGGIGYISLGDIPEWDAADRTPLPWATPVDFVLPDAFPGKPGAILVLRAEELGSSATIRAVTVDGWRLVTSQQADDSRQVVRLPRVNGLTPGLKYRLTLLILPE